MRITRIAAVAALIVGLSTVATTVSAQVTLTAASAFPRGHAFSKKFERFIEEVNKRAKGSLVIDYKGGAPAIGSPFTLGQRVQRGQFDLMGNTGPYYDSLLPEALSLTVSEYSIQELRANGGFALLRKVHEDRGLYLLGRAMEYLPFNLYLRKPIEGANLSGLRLRVAPHFQSFFSSLGATTVRSDLSEIYTFMENGSIEGFGWPIQGFLPDWMKVTKYRVEPGFYNADIHIVFNLDSWKKLSPEQKKLIEEVMVEFEATNRAEADAGNAANRNAQKDAGIQVIQLGPEDAKKWTAAARNTIWSAIVERSPENGPKLRKLMVKE